MKTGFKRKRIIIATVIALIIALAVYLNFYRIYVYYRYAFIGNDLKQGDELYLSKKLFNPDRVEGYGAYRLIRPLTSQEIDDEILLSDEKKTELKKIANSSNENYATPLAGVFVYKKMQQNGTMLLGTFIEKRLVTAKNTNGESNIVVFYGIKPLSKIFREDALDEQAFMPKGYALANDVVYIDSRAIDNDQK